MPSNIYPEASIKSGAEVKLAAGTAEVGKLAAGTAAIGSVTLGAGAAEVGKLAAGTAAIGSVTIGAGSARTGKLVPEDTWYVNDTDEDTAGTTSTAAKAGESTKNHYLCGFMAAIDQESSGTMVGAVVKLTQGSGGYTLFRFQMVSNTTYTGYTPGQTNPVVVNFQYPIKINTSSDVTLTVDPTVSSGTTCNSSATIWGFTI
jgi:hypothetical protein